MRIHQVHIEGFRGIKKGTFRFDEHTALIGPNGTGKSSVLDALALIFQRDRWYHLTEHDFYGSDPKEEHRIKVIATLCDFPNNDPNRNRAWFNVDAGAEVWFNKASNEYKMEKTEDSDVLCVQVAYCARFDRDELEVVTKRYFVNPQQEQDPFVTEMKQISRGLLDEIGFFLVPTSRTFERALSFASPVFRALIQKEAGLPADVILAERDRLRSPSPGIEESSPLNTLVEEINAELARFLPESPKLKFRLTLTDCESLLDAIAPHYSVDWAESLPARRHGSGLLSLQLLVLLLGLVKRKVDEGKNAILAIEEPELHLPPGIQQRIIYQAKKSATQTLCTTHSPRVASSFPPTSVNVLRRVGDEIVSTPLLEQPLTQMERNAVRRLFDDMRLQLIEALMQRLVLVPEGRIDYEWLKRLSAALETRDGQEQADVPFSSIVGVIPTHDASVINTYDQLKRLHPRVCVLVDGDAAGNGYVSDLVTRTPAPTVIQWPTDWKIEEVINWITIPKEAEILSELNSSLPSDRKGTSILDVLSKEKNKDNYLLFDHVSSEIRRYDECAERASYMLNSLRLIASGSATEGTHMSRHASHATVFHWKTT